MIVNQQVKVLFSIRTHKDEVDCDIVPMEARHILLGMPWQFDRKIIYNGLTNEITLTHLVTKFVLNPQTHSQVAKDQLTMKDMRDEEEKLEKQKMEYMQDDLTEAHAEEENGKIWSNIILMQARKQIKASWEITGIVFAILFFFVLFRYLPLEVTFCLDIYHSI